MALPRWAIASWEGGAAQRLVAGLAPPFDRLIVEARLGEVMRQHFGLGGGR
jgi:hypothetical protein